MAGPIRREGRAGKGKKRDAQRKFVYDGIEHYLYSPYCNAKTLSELSESLNYGNYWLSAFWSFNIFLRKGT